MTGLTSFRAGMRAVVIGASGGIGRGLTASLAADPAVDRVLALARAGTQFEHATQPAIDLSHAHLPPVFQLCRANVRRTFPPRHRRQL